MRELPEQADSPLFYFYQDNFFQNVAYTVRLY